MLLALLSVLGATALAEPPPYLAPAPDLCGEDGLRVCYAEVPALWVRLGHLDPAPRLQPASDSAPSLALARPMPPVRLPPLSPLSRRLSTVPWLAERLAPPPSAPRCELDRPAQELIGRGLVVLGETLAVDD